MWFEFNTILASANVLNLRRIPPVSISRQGAPRPNRKEAKQAAALEAVRRLHKLKYLDDHLLPIRVPKELVDTDYWFPNWDLDDAAKHKTSAATSEGTVTTNLRVG